MGMFPDQFILSDPTGTPVCPRTRIRCDVTAAKFWVSHEETIRACAGSEYLPGFSVTPPYFFIDIDGAWDGKHWSHVATEVYNAFQGCYREVSRSGTGLHIIGRYTGAEPEHRCKNHDAHLELYTSKRFCALTGLRADGDPNRDATAALRTFIEQYMAPIAPVVSTVPSDTLGLPDDEVLRLALSRRSGASMFGGKASFKDLWEGNLEALSVTYPASNGRPYDYSSADAALCAHLAFWTGRNQEQMERMFNQSALAQRDKWRQREDYRTRTIQNAVARCTQVYQPKVQEPAVAVRTGYQIVPADQQLEMFKGCCYIAGVHKVLTPVGVLMKPDVFKAMYGGYVFMLDSIGHKTTTNAWTAFTESQALQFPRAHSACFRPEEPPGAVLREENWDVVNCYVPIDTPRAKGDVSPFLRHLEKMLPDERDRTILLSYMAAMVQNIGAKFQWAPLLQGCPGNGKTLAIRVMEAIMGRRYTHIPKAEQLLKSDFNGWLFGKLFIGVEEIRISDRWDLAEALKEVVTNDRLEIQGKGQDQVTGDNRANFIFCSNYKDAIPKTVTDRRYCVLYTAQQSRADMEALGWIHTNYFPKLFAWCRSGGYAYIHDWLWSYRPAPEFDPVGTCQWAPETTSTREAYGLTKTVVEQEIEDAVGEELPGFRGGWISTKAIGLLLDRKKLKLSPHRRAAMLEDMGYVKAPGLDRGRAAQVILEEGGRPYLYMKKDTVIETLDATQAYRIAQGYRV